MCVLCMKKVTMGLKAMKIINEYYHREKYHESHPNIYQVCATSFLSFFESIHYER